MPDRDAEASKSMILATLSAYAGITTIRKILIDRGLCTAEEWDSIYRDEVREAKATMQAQIAILEQLDRRD